MSKFIGRKNELQRLIGATKKQSASFIILKGRRRIGKSRLVEEFGKNFDRFVYFRGIAPTDNTTVEMQLQEFSRQLAENFNIPHAQYLDWGDVFWALSERVKKGKVLLVFDEISWMGFNDPTFLSKVKDAWDTHFKKNNQLIFIVCGSASAWIEKNIMSHAGFVGRISFSMTLNELPIADCVGFWPKNISYYEILKVLCITGGVPKYLEEINPKLSAEDNIKQLCFTSGGILVEEFRQIFSDIFLRDSNYYLQILNVLSSGSKDSSQISSELNLTSSGRIAEYLWELELAGFISRDFTWQLKTGSDSKLSLYRLKDNYLRFYLKYIQKNHDKIKRGSMQYTNMSSLSNWTSVLGLQFENLILANRVKLHQLLMIKPEEIINANPYFQMRTKSQHGCQVDYMIQTQFGTLYIIEFKFSTQPIGLSIVDELETKIKAISAPKRFSFRPILIHANGISQKLSEQNYFSQIIDIEEFFK